MAKQPSRPVSDLFLALFSLFLALIVWIIVKQQESIVRTIWVRVQPDLATLAPYIELDPESPEPKLIAVEVSAPKAEEQYIKSEDFRLRVPLDTLTDRASSQQMTSIPVEVSTREVAVPASAPRLRVVQFVDPSNGSIRQRVPIQLRARIRVVPARVIPLIVGTPAPGFEVERDGIEIELASPVLVAVDEERYMKAQSEELVVQTEAIQVEGKRDVVSDLYSIPFEDPANEMYAAGIYAVPGKPLPKIGVIIPLRELDKSVTFPGVEFRYDPLQSGVVGEVSPATLDVQVTGPASVVERLTADMIRLYPGSWIEDTPGSVVDTLVEAGIETTDEAIRPRLKSLRIETQPRTVKIRINEERPEAALPPKEVPVSPEDRPTTQPAVALEDERTSPTRAPASTPSGP
ncbi:hypothetical protein HZA57_02415 [Candidatus Poribacteria bacterium]|nr:hypothetical protein [Candidatus Poribacteria bacterium]